MSTAASRARDATRSTVREQPRADDVVRLRPQVHRERPREQSPDRRLPAADDERRQRRRRPGVHDVGIADESARLVALVGAVTRRARRSTDRSAAAIPRGTSRPRRSRRCRRRRTGYQTGNGTPKNRWRLTHQSPVSPFTQFSYRAPHVRRMPLQLAPAREQRLAKLHRPDEPLPARDDLERPIALLVELHVCVIGRGSPTRSPVSRSSSTISRARLRGGEAGQLVVVLLCARPRRRDSQPARPTSPAATCRSAGSPRAPAATARATTSRP